MLVTDNIKLKRGLLSLENLSLVKWSRETNALSIHRVIQAVVEDELPKTAIDACVLSVLQLCCIASPKGTDEESINFRQRFQNQVVGPLFHLRKFRNVRLGLVSSFVANSLVLHGKIGDAKRLHIQAVDTLSESYNDDDAVLLDARTALAICYGAGGDYNEALELLQMTMKGLSALVGQNHLDTIRAAMLSKGLALRDLGRYSEAAEVQEQLLITLPKDHELRAEATNILGFVYLAQERFFHAKPLFEEAIALYRNLPSNRGRFAPEPIANLAFVSAIVEESTLEQAAEQFEYIQRELTELCGRDDLRFLEVAQYLGLVYLLLGRLDESKKQMEMSFATKRKTLREKHVSTLNTMINVGWCYREPEMLREAEELQKSALDLARATLGAEHPVTLRGVD